MQSENKKYPTVSDVNLYLKQIISKDENLKKILVMGEISNFTDHARLGHLYFSVKDEKCAIKAVMFKRNKERLNFKPENGMKVVIFGSVNVYERDGIFQIVAENMIPYGEGALQKAFEELKSKLAGEGLFAPEHKKKIPSVPKKIGVITAKKSAALQDIINIISRRYPLVTLVVIDSLVQGENAPEHLCMALDSCKALNLDTIIIGRGGGSKEDLWAFNDERLARKIYDCEIPIISAVGHEIDFTICDYVADMRAPTPSAAAELAVPSSDELRKFIDNKRSLLYNNINNRFNRYKLLFDGLDSALAAREPNMLISAKREYVKGLYLRFSGAFGQVMQSRVNSFVSTTAKLDVLSPLKTLTRGYSVTTDSAGAVISDVSKITPGDIIKNRLSNGEIQSTATAVKLYDDK